MAENTALQRGLKTRHIQMIALGGAIGTGLFYGSAEAIQLAGPATILSYLCGGIIIYLILRMMGEMSVDEPVAGGFTHFAYKYGNSFSGFLSGWNYWFLYILVSMAELTVVGIYMNRWLPIDHWVTSLTVLIVITLINLINVRAFGEFEFWFSLIKVLAVCGMIVFGLILIVTGWGGDHVALSNLWTHGGFIPMGVGGLFLGLVVVMFSFGGTELIGVAAGEAEQPEKTIPKAISQVMWRILIFYIGAIAVIMILIPWNEVGAKGSPFVLIFDKIGISYAGDLLNLVVLVAAISVYNSGIYSNGRMLYALAQQGNAPSFFLKVSKRRTPYVAILFSSACTLVVVMINYLIPEGAFMKVMAGAMSAAVITWITIVVVHLRFRRAKMCRNEKTVYPSPFFPFSNYLCLVFLLSLIISMLATGFTENGIFTNLLHSLNIGNSSGAPLISLKVTDMSIAALIIPVWLYVLYVGYRIKILLSRKHH